MLCTIRHIMLLLPVLAFCGCSSGLRQEHFQAAQRALQHDSDLPLALWHLEEYLADAPAADPNLALAQLQAEQCRSRLRSRLGENPRMQDLELQVKLLEQQNRELSAWKERLTAENSALRAALIRTAK